MENQPTTWLEPCYRYAVDRVLRDCTLSTARRLAIVRFMVHSHGSNLNKQATGLAHLVGADFVWPWFDHWATRFVAEGAWPEYAIGWGWIEAAAKPAPATTAQYLRGLKKADLLTLAVRRGVVVATSIKVGQLRCALLKALGRAGLAEEVAMLARATVDEAETQAAWEKLRLLVQSLSSAAHARYRMDQIAQLLKDSRSRWRVYLDPGDPADAWASRFCEGWAFNPRDPDNLPPFFPGDTTSLHTERLPSR